MSRLIKVTQLSFVLILICFSSANSQRLKNLIGQALPENIKGAILYNVNNDAFTLDEILNKNKDKIILIDFWASWCGACRKEIVFLKNINKHLKNKPFVILSISVDNEKELWKKSINRYEMPGQLYILDFNSKPPIKEYFKIKGIPYYFLLDKEGKILNPRANWPHEEKLFKEIKHAIEN